MPETQVVLYEAENRAVPFLEWLDRLPPKAQDKCIVRVERLAAMGYELRRPEADFLRNGIYELRFAHQAINYRVLYFFCGRRAVISHGIAKERAVPSKEIDLALQRKARFAADPERHTYKE